MGLFEKLASETPTGGGRWFNEGNYVCRVKRCQHFVSKQQKGNGIVIEVVILAVTMAYAAGRKCWIDGSELQASNGVGETCATVLWLDRQLPAMGNLKGFLLAASGLTELQVVQAYCQEHGLQIGGMTPDNRPVDVAAWDHYASLWCGGTGETLAGAIVSARNNRVRTKAGTAFGRTIWERPTPGDLAAVEQQQAALNAPNDPNAPNPAPAAPASSDAPATPTPQGGTTA